MREGGSRWFYFVCCDAYFYSLAAFPLEFNKVPFEGFSPSWLCCKEPGSWTRVTDGSQLTCAKVVSADIKVRPWWGGSEGIVGSLRHTGCPPGSLFSGSSLGESGFCFTKEGDVFYPGLQPEKPLNTGDVDTEIKQAEKRKGWRWDGGGRDMVSRPCKFWVTLLLPREKLLQTRIPKKAWESPLPTPNISHTGCCPLALSEMCRVVQREEGCPGPAQSRFSLSWRLEAGREGAGS